MEDPEEQCENAVFEVCDARERFPQRCAEELDKYLNAKNTIAMEPIVLKPSPEIFEIPQTSYIRENIEKENSERGNDIHLGWNNGAEQLQRMIDKIQDLKVALKRLEGTRNFEIKHHLK